MNEVYAEWLVKRKTPSYAILIKAVMIALCLLAFFLSVTPILGFFGIIILAVVGAGTYFVFRNLEVEFEYLYVSGQLSVDRILGRSKRKKAWESSMEEIEIVAPSDSYLIKDHESPNMKLLDFSSHQAGAKTYIMISRAGANVSKVIFEPNDKILQCMRMAAPRKVVL